MRDAMFESKRDRRRRDEARCKARVRRVIRYAWGFSDPTTSQVGRAAAIHMAHYPCHLCGNPRTTWWAGPKFSERRKMPL